MEFNENTMASIRKYAEYNFEACLGKTLEEIEKLMKIGSVNSDIVKISEIIDEPDFYTLVGSTVLQFNNLLGRHVGDIDIAVEKRHEDIVVKRLSTNLKHYTYRYEDESSNEFQMFTENINAKKFILPSGKVLDVFIMSNAPQSNLMTIEGHQVNVETVGSVIEAKREYLKTGRLSPEKSRKQHNDLQFIIDKISV